MKKQKAHTTRPVPLHGSPLAHPRVSFPMLPWVKNAPCQTNFSHVTSHPPHPCIPVCTMNRLGGGSKRGYTRKPLGGGTSHLTLPPHSLLFHRRSPPDTRFLVEDAGHPSCNSPNISRRFAALGACHVRLVRENPTCSVPAK